MPRPSGRAELYLHIGRNKAGSTTLQKHWLGHLEALRRAGVEYTLFGQPSPPGSGLPSFPSHLELIAFIQAQKQASVLMSNEGICCFLDPFGRAMARDLAAEVDLNVLFYTRPYRDWLVSSYGFDVRIGRTGADFDRYLAMLWPKISVWPVLATWGEAIGWDRMRVRSLDPRDLVGGDLRRDGDAAIGVNLPISGPAPRDNASTSWVTVELMRTLVGADVGEDDRHPYLTIGDILETGDVIDHYVVAGMEALGERPGAGAYLTRDQSQALAQLYNRDLDRLEAATGVRLQRDEAPAAPDRGDPPAVAHVSARLLRFIRDCASDPQSAHPRLVSLAQTHRFRNLVYGELG